ncbi:MAG: histidine phosphatase family protein [Alphaproteobacteria bacterium]|nr:histidine phosphatase family protein [Alphaproteobacteria bacterium]
MRIILVRHGQPHIALSPRTGHRGFGDYIDAYEAAGLDPASLPPQELAELARELTSVFASDRPRSHQSAAALAPHATPIRDPLFAEAALASPPIPFLKMNVPSWAVVSRLLWHIGFSPRVEGWFAAQRRADRAADLLIARAAQDGAVALVAHGYFNWMIGRVLKRRGFVKRGSHRARYWNSVTYEKAL